MNEQSAERLIAHLNSRLSQGGRCSVANQTSQGEGILLVVGPPRSGTTVLMQEMAAATGVGYPSNLIARFWMDPRVGIAVQHSLFGVVRPPLMSSRANALGQTKGILEPHEFGRFWSVRCGFPYGTPSVPAVSTINWDYVVSSLLEFREAFDRPVILKGFHVIPYLSRLLELLPSVTLVRTRRNPVETAASITKVRSTVPVYQEWLGPSTMDMSSQLTGRLEEDSRVQVQAIEAHLDAVTADNNIHVVEVSLDSVGEDVARAANALQLPPAP